MLDECYSGIPRTPAAGLVLGDGSPSIPAFTLYALHPTLYTFTRYTLRPTQVFPSSVMCTAVVRRVFRVSVSIRAHPWAVYLRHLLCFASGLAIFSPLSFRSRGCLVLADFPASKSLPLHLTHSPLHQKNHQKDIFFAFFFDLMTGFVSLM